MNDLTMKSFIAEPLQRTKVEFWAATTIFVFALFSLITASSPNEYDFEESGYEFHYYKNHFWPQLIRYSLLYLSFLLLNFKVLPGFISRQKVWRYAFVTLLAFVALSLFTGILDTYTKGYLFNRFDTEDETYNHIFQNSFRYTLWLFLMFGFYSAIKFTGLYLLSNSTVIQSKYRIITSDALTAFVFWMVSVFLLLIMDVGEEITVVWAVFSLSALLLYCISFYTLIPKALTRKKPLRSYILRSLLVLALAFLPVAFIVMAAVHQEDTAFGVSFFNMLFQLAVTVPVTWVLFRRHATGNEEVYVLKKELGRSNANLDFLRSQINPHFLFNALNTLYGTALQENSERTAQGIQMLGDMMRFMLHENHQPRILLSREVEYMRNYIDLQLLRTSTSPDIVIETRIEDVLTEKYIAPMLLIPFVENAFKHGISLKERSWIRISLHTDQSKLYFDVYNSKHPKLEQDPEKDQSGIGLSNVKQRLDLLYPGKHELITRETPEEFFVHLTLEL